MLGRRDSSIQSRSRVVSDRDCAPQGTEVVRSKDAGFYNDAVDIRAIARVGFGFLQPAAVIRLYDAA